MMSRFGWLLMLLVPTMIHAETVKVAVAANFLKTIETLGQNFEKQTGNAIKVSAGPTGKLYAQIENGAPFDIFFAADQKSTKKLEDDGKIKQGSRIIYAQGRLLLWMPNIPAGVEATEVLKKGNFKHIALANPKAAPYGVAAEQTLEKLGLLDSLRSKFVMGENIGQTYQFVATGNAQLGFVAHSYTVDPKHVNTGSYWLVPLSYHASLDQDVVILKKAEHSQVVQSFIDYVKSAEGKKIIEASGYMVP